MLLKAILCITEPLVHLRYWLNPELLLTRFYHSLQGLQHRVGLLLLVEIMFHGLVFMLVLDGTYLITLGLLTHLIQQM